MHMIKILFILFLIIGIPSKILADPPARVYAQILIHTADGATYVVTGDLGSLFYKSVGNDFVACLTVNGAIGLPPATNDTIFKDSFESVLCYQE